MPVIDLHCDTLYQLWKTKNPSLNRNGLKVDLERLRKTDSLVQCFALFNDNLEPDTFDSWLDFYNFYIETLDLYRDEITVIHKSSDIKKARDEGKLCAMLTVESVRVIGDDVEKLVKMQELGVRMASLVWSHENKLAYPNHSDPKMHALGLKPSGRKAVELMEALGIILDVSHLSMGGTLEALAMSHKPVIASHSLAREVLDFRRNLTDPEIRGIAESGGVIGINFCPEFLGKDEKVSLENIANHVKHIRSIGGSEVLAIGTDFDGFTARDTEYPDVGYLHKLYEDLMSTGFTQSFLDGMFYKNALRVFTEVF